MRYIKNRDIQTLELLAPAKNLECGIAAIDHGADAVYIGADHFGARAAAGNSTDDIARLCSYAHQFGARVYVTVNTIVYDNEIDSVRRLLKRIGEAGADAILVQDMALVSMLSDIGLEMHASTQTDNRTADKVEWLRELGFKRVVLARELSVDEIAEIHAKHPDVELEVFVHGALCVSYSGQCYASQYCFQRSANRGECAQFCRLHNTLRVIVRKYTKTFRPTLHTSRARSYIKVLHSYHFHLYPMHRSLISHFSHHLCYVALLTRACIENQHFLCFHHSSFKVVGFMRLTTTHKSQTKR